MIDSDKTIRGPIPPSLEPYHYFYSSTLGSSIKTNTRETMLL